MKVSEYIAQEYSIESAVYYWTEDKHHLYVEGRPVSINQFIEYYADPKDLIFENDYDNPKLNDRVFLASQWAVNGSCYANYAFENMMNINNKIVIQNDLLVFNGITNEKVPNGWERRCECLENLERIIAGNT